MKSCQREDNIEKSKEDFIENQYLRGGDIWEGGGEDAILYFCLSRREG